MKVTDAEKMANLLYNAGHHVEAAHDRIEREGSVADASLLLAVSTLLEAVKTLEQQARPVIEYVKIQALGE